MAPMVMRSILRAPSASIAFSNANKRVTFADSVIIPPSIILSGHTSVPSTLSRQKGVIEHDNDQVLNQSQPMSQKNQLKQDASSSSIKQAEEKEKELEQDDRGQQQQQQQIEQTKHSNRVPVGTKGTATDGLLAEPVERKPASAQKDEAEHHELDHASPGNIRPILRPKHHHEPKRSASTSSHSTSSVRSQTNRHSHVHPRSRTHPRARSPKNVREPRAMAKSRVSKKRTSRSTRRSLMSVSSSPSLISEKAEKKAHGKKVGRKHREDPTFRSASKNIVLPQINEAAQNDNKNRRVKKVSSFHGHKPHQNVNEQFRTRLARKTHKESGNPQGDGTGERISRKVSGTTIGPVLIPSNEKRKASSKDIYTVQVARSFVAACAQLSPTDGLIMAVDGKALYRMVSVCRRQSRHNRVRTPIELRSEGLRAMLIETEESMRLPSDTHEGRRDLRRRRSIIIKFVRSEGRGEEVVSKVASWESLQKAAVSMVTRRIERLLHRQDL